MKIVENALKPRRKRKFQQSYSMSSNMNVANEGNIDAIQPQTRLGRSILVLLRRRNSTEGIRGCPAGVDSITFGTSTH
jgi:hypothetical protein